MLAPGQILGDYELVTKLRSGGMADLYLAKREGPGGFARHVAIKVVHPRLARDRAFVDMFLDEARLAAAISHPNVVHIEDLGEKGGTYYLVMEYLHGATLAQLFMGVYRFGRRLSPTTATSLVADAAAGLHAAHQARGRDGQLLNVVHRDVSPQNLFLTNEGELKVIDFGIARASGRLHKTQGNQLKGKMAYMPPEQFMGEKIDHRADIYALGVVLWEALTLERLFPAKDDFSLIQAVRAGPRCAPSALVPHVSPALDRVVMSALATDPNRRPATARDLRHQLLEAEPEARHVERIDLAGLLFAVLADELAAQAKAMGRPSLAAPMIDTYEMESTPLQCLDRLTVPHGDDFDDDEATIVDSDALDALLGATVPAGTPTPKLSEDLFGDVTAGAGRRGSQPITIGGQATARGSVGPPPENIATRQTSPVGSFGGPPASAPRRSGPPAVTTPQAPHAMPKPAVGPSSIGAAHAVSAPPANPGFSGGFTPPPPVERPSALVPILIGLALGAGISAAAVYFFLLS